MKWLIAFSISVSLLSCSQQAEEQPVAEPIAAPKRTPTPPSPMAIFEDEAPSATPVIPYRIINRNEHGPNLSFDIEVDLVDERLPNEDEIRQVSIDLKRKSGGNHPTTFVVVYLPGMVVDAGGYATAHHQPNVEVRFFSWDLPERYRGLR